ncbi:hypothetical protein CASFOL_010141 [Castilleja foliolosa]|uniref:Uncharacterized protein n=1 Tax=Castilleja foliolosa TaxID=1961234 RepID=A0ABD3DRR1_9LAMI
MLRSAAHRVVTNKEEARTSITTFINPNPDCVIEPAKVCVNDVTPPLYQPLSFKDFVNVSKPFGPFTDVVQNGSLDFYQVVDQMPLEYVVSLISTICTPCLLREELLLQHDLKKLLQESASEISRISQCHHM